MYSLFRLRNKVRFPGIWHRADHQRYPKSNGGLRPSPLFTLNHSVLAVIPETPQVQISDFSSKADLLLQRQAL